MVRVDRTANAQPGGVIVVPVGGADALADRLTATLGATRGRVEIRRFPDDETYVRLDTPIAGHDVLVVAALRAPDPVLVPLTLLAATARDLGARRVGLVAPYLPYMRQDARFRPGEGVTSRYVGRWLSGLFDWLVTIDPHLHRHTSLADVYEVPATALTATPAIAAWIRAHVATPVLVGPDAESAQWVHAVALLADAPSLVLEKERLGDRTVDVTIPDVARWQGHTPVLIDDIVSTAQTMSETIRQLRRVGLRAPVCIAVHAIFADDADVALTRAGAASIVTCDTIPHPTNAIATFDILVDGIGRHLDASPPIASPAPAR
jgi:ribose-phosphate pyrophosphokinase